MANTKVTGDLIASSTIATGNIADNAVTSDKISGITTAHITEGSNLYYTNARADARITAATTSDLTEGTNLYYTDARADARAALLVDSAPSTLDTLNELAAALGDDPNFATTTANSIGLKAPLASPTFTGNSTFAGPIYLLNTSARISAGGSGEVGFNYNTGATGSLVWYGGGTASKFNVTSAGNATFTGSVTINNNTPLIVNGTDPLISFQNSATNHWQVGLENTNSDRFVFYDNNAAAYQLILNSTSGNATFAGTVTAAQYYKSSTAYNVIGTASSGEVILRPTAWNLSTAQSSFSTTLATIGTDATFAGAVTIPGAISAGTNGGLRIHSSGTKFFNVTAANAARNNIMDIGAPDAKFKDLYLGGSITAGGEISSSDDININNGKLVVYHASAEVRIKSTSDTGESYISFSDPSDINPGQIYYGHSSNAMVFRTNDNDRMRIDSSGNVGIGYNDPQTLLHLKKSTGAIIRLQSEINNTEGGLYGGMEWYNTDPSTYGPQVVSNIMSYQADSLGRGGYITFGTTQGYSEANPIERMRITSWGNVGIGATSPTGVKFQTVQTTSGEWTGDFKNSTANGYGLRVDMSNSSSVQSALQVYTGAGTGFVVKNTGKVGIGTHSPSYPLEVNGQISISNATAPQLLFFEPGRAYTEGMRLARYQDKLSLTYGWNANEEALTVVGGTGSDVGNVGIGTISPRAKLEVASDITIQNGVYTYQATGTAVGWDALNFDITVNDEGGGGNVFKIEAGFSHYYAIAHASIGEWWSTTRGTAIVNTYILNAGSTNAGTWSASKPTASILRISKSAGTYGGGGKYWVKVTYRPY